MARFEVVEDEITEPSPSPKEQFPKETLDTILLGLKALPQRMAKAISDCFALLTVATVFWLAMLIVPYEPSSYQLTGLAGFALFIIAINVITRRR